MKKKILLSFLGSSLSVSVFGQGTVVLENAVSTGNVTLVNWDVFPNTTDLAPAGTYQVALLWFNGTSFQESGAVYQTTAGRGDGTGYFFGETVTVPTYAAVGTFEVVGWTGNHSSYAAAIASGGPADVGATPSFVSAEGNGTTTPPGLPVNLSGGSGGWDGNLVLIGDYVLTPEPSTFALAGLAGVLWVLCRRK